MASSRDLPASDRAMRPTRPAHPARPTRPTRPARQRLGAMGRIASVALALGIAPTVAGCGSLLPAATASDTVSRSVTVPATSTVDVRTFNGDIDVVPGPDGTVSAQVKRTGEGPSESAALADAQKIDVTLTLQGSTAILTATYTPSPDRITGSRGAAATVTVPAGSSLKLATSNGEIAVRGVSGGVTATTSNGRVTVEDAAAAVSIDATNGEVAVRGQATRVRARTSNGAIRVDGAGGVVDIETTNGAIEVTGGRDVSLTAGTSNGRVAFTGTLAGGTQVLRNSNGPITVTLPADATFGIDASTTNGKVTTAFAVTTTGVASDKELHGTVGQGPAARISATTSNGDVSVLKGQ